LKFRWIIWLSVVVFLWIVLTRLTEIEHLVATLAGGDWLWVFVAAELQVLYYGVRAGLYQVAFSGVGVKSHIAELFPVTLSSLFLNVTAPTGGASGAALFVDYARRRGQSGPRAAVGTFIVLTADFIAFTFFLAAGMAYLFLVHDLKAYQITATILLLALTLGLSALMALGLLAPRRLRRVLKWMMQGVNRLATFLKRTKPISDQRLRHISHEFADAAQALAAHPRSLARILAVALAGHLVDLLSLAALFRAFQQPASLGVIVAGYAMGILFWIVSITPQGIGVVEGTMTLVFTSLGMSGERAAVIALSFRGLTFWLPFLAGFLLLRRVRAFTGEPPRPILPISIDTDRISSALRISDAKEPSPSGSQDPKAYKEL